MNKSTRDLKALRKSWKRPVVQQRRTSLSRRPLTSENLANMNAKNAAKGESKAHRICVLWKLEQLKKESGAGDGSGNGDSYCRNGTCGLTVMTDDVAAALEIIHNC